MPLIINGGGSSALYNITLKLREAGNRFGNLAYQIQPVPVVGPILFTGFWALSLAFLDAADFFSDFEWFYYQFKSALDAFFNGEGFDELLDIVFPQWRELVSAPFDFILDALGLAYPHAYNLFLAPAAWLRAFFYDAFPWIVPLFANPEAWFADLLFTVSPVLWGVYDQGIRYLVEVIYLLYPDMRWIFDDPLEWLQLQLHRMTDIPWEWLTDPTGNLLELVLDQLESKMQASKGKIIKVGERLLRFLWEGVS